MTLLLLGVLSDCLKNNKDFNVDTFLSYLEIERETLLATTLLWTGENYANLKHSDEYFWSPLFHDEFGPCFSFDLSKAEEFEFVQFQEKGRLTLEFHLADDIPWSKLIIILHSKNDFPDAQIITGVVISNQTFHAHRLTTRKKVSNRESTRTILCTEYDQRTCRNIEDNKLILSKLDCRLPILYQGHHLDHLFTEEIPGCNNSIIEKAVDLLMSKRSKCPRSQACHKREYTTKHEFEPIYIENKTVVLVRFDTPQVEYQNTYISYGLISLIGEVGGILGLTLGVSGLTMFDSLLKYVPYY